VCLEVLNMITIYDSLDEESKYHRRALYCSWVSKKYRKVKEEALKLTYMDGRCLVNVRYAGVPAVLEAYYKKVDYFYDYSVLDKTITDRFNPISKLMEVEDSKPLFDINPYWIKMQEALFKHRNSIKKNRSPITRALRYWCKSRNLPPMFYYCESKKLIYQLEENFYKLWYIKANAPQAYAEMRDDTSVDTIQLKYSEVGEFELGLDVKATSKEIISSFNSGKTFSERTKYKLDNEANKFRYRIIRASEEVQISESRVARSFYSFFKMFDRGVYPRGQVNHFVTSYGSIFENELVLMHYMNKNLLTYYTPEVKVDPSNLMEEKDYVGVRELVEDLIDGDLNRLYEYYLFKEQSEREVDQLLNLNMKLRKIEEEYSTALKRVQEEFEEEKKRDMLPKIKIKNSVFLLKEPVKIKIKATEEEINRVRIPWLRQVRDTQKVESWKKVRRWGSKDKTRDKTNKIYVKESKKARNFIRELRGRTGQDYVITSQTQTWVEDYFDGAILFEELILAMDLLIKPRIMDLFE